jgi:hypothetical protein
VDLEAYRRSAEEFVSELTGEFYRHYAGLKEGYEIEPIYARHAELFEAGAVVELREHLAAAPPGSDQRRRLTLLLDFALEGHLGEATKTAEAELARREAGLKLELDGGESIGFRESAVAQANEPDAARRVAIEKARLEATNDHLNDLYEEVIGTQHALARRLGYASYRELCAEAKGIDLAGLNVETSAFAERSAPKYGEVVDPALRASLGYGLEHFARADIPRFFRAPELDRLFPRAELIGSFEQTLHGLGIDVRSQSGVIFDVESRPNKSPRAFCAPVRAPGEVYLVLAPTGGHEDYSVLFHEGGHTEHYASVDPELPFEFRMLGDNSVTETFAFLFQHLVENPAWLERRLGVSDPGPVAGHARAQRLIYLRRYGAKLAYELELHDGDGALTELAPRYAELLGAALQIDWPQETFLSDVDPGFYSACYLRAWALEAHLRRHMTERFGPAWFEVAEAGAVLISLWREGQRRAPEELLDELAGERLRFGVLLEDLALLGA